jgi:hypothetical protein
MADTERNVTKQRDSKDWLMNLHFKSNHPKRSL